METLYKKDSKGKILKWKAEVNQDAFGVSIHIEYGEYDGKQVQEKRTDIKGKNINKSNETSPFQQAHLDVQSLYAKKKKRGYKSLSDLKYSNDDAFAATNVYQFLVNNLSINTTDDKGVLKPMKCQQYYRSKKNWIDPSGKEWDDRKYYYLANPNAPKEKNSIIIKFPCLIQPKINGARAFIRMVDGEIKITSKDGLDYNLPHISDWFKANVNWEELEENVIFDGELYIHGEPLQTISSALKAYNFNTPRLQFVCFDLAIENIPQLERIKSMKQILKNSEQLIETPVFYITTNKIGNDEIAQKFTDDYIKGGFEGSVLRAIDNVYGFGKRPVTIVKLKRCMDAEFKIVDIIPQDKRPDLGLYVCRTKEGKEFKVTPHMSNDEAERLLILKHDYIGKMLTCTFYEYTEDGKPFHVNNSVIRDYE